MSLKNNGKNGNGKNVEKTNPAETVPAEKTAETAEKTAETVPVTLTAEEITAHESALATIDARLTELRKPGRKTDAVQKETDELRAKRAEILSKLGRTETAEKKTEKTEKTDEEIRKDAESFATSKGAMHVSTSLNVETVTAVFHRILFLTGLLVEETSKREREKIAESILGRFVILRDSGVSLMRYAVTIPGHVRAAYSGNNPADALTVFEKIDALNVHSREFGLPDSPDPICMDTVTGETLSRDALKTLATPVVPATK